MNRKIFFVVLVLLFVPNSLLAFDNVPDNFRGIKWGAKIEDCPDLYVVHKPDNPLKKTLYARKNDKMRIGNAKIEYIKYQFYKEQFCGVTIVLDGESNFQFLKDVFFNVYGVGYKRNQSIEDYRWVSINMGISLHFFKDRRKGMAMYHYLPILKQRQIDKKESSKKAAKDL